MQVLGARSGAHQAGTRRGLPGEVRAAAVGIPNVGARDRPTRWLDGDRGRPGVQIRPAPSRSRPWGHGFGHGITRARAQPAPGRLRQWARSTPSRPATAARRMHGWRSVHISPSTATCRSGP